jgi:hypothetical protein
MPGGEEMVLVEGNGQSNSTDRRCRFLHLEFQKSLDSEYIGRNEVKLVLLWIKINGRVLVLMKRGLSREGTASEHPYGKNQNNGK